MTEAIISPEKKIYFASDFHLGIPDAESSRVREKKVVQWLSSIENDAAAIFLLGDLFDFWCEYKTVIPKGFIRLQGKLAELSDKGIPITIFAGNHDLWMFDYFPTEMNINIYKGPLSMQLGNHSFLLGHGDGLGPGEKGYKIIRRMYMNVVFQKIYTLFHPYWGINLGQYLSKQSRVTAKEENFLGEDNEWLLQYCKEEEMKKHHDFYIFGHRHLLLDIPFGNSRYINTGEWVHSPAYAKYDGKQVTLHKVI